MSNSSFNSNDVGSEKLFGNGLLSCGNPDFILPKELSLDDLHEIQRRLLRIALQVTTILERHGFKYSIAFGTLLGAVRHQGFIPWDDDFDFFLFDDEYEAAVQVLRQELPTDMIVHDQLMDSSYYAAWSKIRDLRSRKRFNEAHLKKKCAFAGVNVDLYKWNRVKRRDVDVFLKREALEYLVRRFDAKMMPQEEYEQKYRNWSEDYLRAEYERDGWTGPDDDVLAFQYLVKKQEIDDVLPLRKYLFEGHEMWGPSNYEAFLKEAYGDYMNLPPLCARKPRCRAIEFL